MEEIWKNVVGFEGYYQISNLGRCLSLKKNIVLKPVLTKKGYCRYTLKDKHKYVHQLIAIHFIPNPENKTFVNHINGIKTDNSISNLEWVTHRENLTHYFKSKTSSSKYTGVNFRKDKKKWEAVIYINKKSIHLGYRNTEIEAHYDYQKALNDNYLFLNASSAKTL